MENRVTKKQQNILPIDKPKKIMIELSFSEEEYNKIINGFRPLEMEDKWFIFFENDWLFFHRSWTGYGIYKAKIITINKRYYINEFFVERNKKKYQNKDIDWDINVFKNLIANFLLRNQ